MNAPDPSPRAAQLEIAQLQARVRELEARESLHQQTTERYRELVEHLGEGMIVIQDDRVVFANAQASDVLRVPPQEMIGSYPVSWLHPDDRAAVEDRIRRRQAGEAPSVHNEFRRVDSDGSWRWIGSRNITVSWDGRPATMSFFRDITEQKHTTTALKLSEERYKAVVEHVGEGMMVMQNGRIVFANFRAAALLRRSREAILADGFFFAVHPEDRSFILERQRRRNSGEILNDRFELRLLHDNGDVTWLEVGVTNVPWEGQLGTLMFFSDINHRKNLQAELRTTLEERETILQNSIMGIAFLTADGRLRWANLAMRTIFAGESAEAVTSMEPFYLSRQQYLQVGADVARCIDAGQDYQHELQMRRLDGKLFWALLSGKAVTPRDRSQGTVWVIMDITARKELEVALQRTSNEREAILNSTLVGISYNRNRRIEWVNDKYVEMTGFSRAELMGSSSRMFYDTEEAYIADGESTMRALQASGTYVDERLIKRRNGEPFWVVLSGRCVVDRNPDAGVIWTMLDITERRQAEEDIRIALQRQTELNELRSRFVSMTSHEFRTPLATIQSSSELLRHYSGKLSDTERVETLSNIETAVQRMTRMLERVLLIGKSEAQMLDYNPDSLNLDTLCRSLVIEALSFGGEPATRLHYRYEGESGKGVYDEKLLRHIFSNLLSNALKYSPNSEVVYFQVHRGAKQTVFEVIDQGIGIPSAEIPHLYESFHRASNVGNIPGTGLGLSIVKKSVEMHGGSIDVVSEAGLGTRFTVTLPHDPSEPTPDRPLDAT